MTTKNLLNKKATPNFEAAGMSVAMIAMVSKTKNGVVFLDEILVISLLVLSIITTEYMSNSRVR